jgi:hypothetical protein
VADYLRRAGVPKDVMDVEGFGKTNPRVRNDSAEDRQKNRRVEIGIVDSILEYKEIAPGEGPVRSLQSAPSAIEACHASRLILA